MEKINVILDTDISNEIDDQFALVYLMNSLENINLEAITIAPFSKNHYINVKSGDESLELSKITAFKILELLNLPEYKDKIFKGSSKFFHECKKGNKATDKIIEVAKRNEQTTIIAIGAIPNVALALYIAPEIAEKVNIVWLGGHSFLSENNYEYNFRQDIEAVRFVFNSKAKLTIIPCRNVASNLSTTIYELEHYLKNAGSVGKYLLDIFKASQKIDRKENIDSVGQSKVLWDISAIAYIINKDWFNSKLVDAPEILDNLSYKFIENDKKINFVMNLNRDKIFQDFFLKLGKTSGKKQN